MNGNDIYCALYLPIQECFQKISHLLITIIAEALSSGSDSIYSGILLEYLNDLLTMLMGECYFLRDLFLMLMPGLLSS